MKQRTVPDVPNFDQSVPKNGYAWWYVDGVSDDGKHALTIIAFVGSVFSPYYAWARARGLADPNEYCALNVVLYGAGGRRWAMTERPGAAVTRATDRLQIGPSSVTWDRSALHYDIDEWTVPLPQRIRGKVRIRPTAISGHEFDLDEAGNHHWRPVAPCARVEVAFTSPALKWSGNAYWDHNAGARPLEDDFVYWNWSRSSQSTGAAILYEGRRRSGDRFSLMLKSGPDGSLERLTPPAEVQLPDTRWWRIARQTRAIGHQASVVTTLEDTPFYSRTLLSANLFGHPAITIHESLSLDRFKRPWVRCLLPFRMPRTSWIKPAQMR